MKGVEPDVVKTLAEYAAFKMLDFRKPRRRFNFNGITIECRKYDRQIICGNNGIDVVLNL